MLEKLFFLNIFLTVGLLTHGQTDTVKVVQLSEIVVTSQRNPRVASEIPFTVNSLRLKSIEELSPRTTPEALMNMNGVFVQKTNHGGGSPFVRGLTGNQTLLLLDGVRLNNSIYRYGPNQYLNTIDALAIDKIEVAIGTGSVQYGSDAMGGVIQVFTKEPMLEQHGTAFRGKVFGKYMTGDMEKSERAELEFSSPKYAALFGATNRDFGDIIGGKRTGKQSPSGYTEYDLDAKIIVALKENIRLTFASQFVKQEDVPVYHKVMLENYKLNEFNPQQRLLTYARLNIQGHQKLFDQVRIIASWQQNEEGRNSQKNGSDLLIREKDRIKTFAFTTDIRSEITKQWSANSGIEIYHDLVGSERHEITNSGMGVSVSKRGLYPDNSRSGNYSLYTLQHFNVGNWLFDGGIRYNLFKISIDEANVGAVDLSPQAFVINAAAMYSINRKHHVYTNFSQGFRAPNIDDMGTLGIVDFRYEIPAYDLRPEKSDNFELGYKVNLQKITGAVAVYRMNLSQLISRIKVDGEFINSYQVYKKENVEKAYIQGLEATITWSPLHCLEINSGVTTTYGQNVTKNEPLRRIPPLFGRMAGSYRFGNFFSRAEFLFASRQDRLAAGDISDNRIAPGGTPGWSVINFYAGYKLKSVRLNAGIQNILNVDYRTHGSGINGVGRSAWLSVCFFV